MTDTFFITGTDTGVGKTYTCRVLGEAFAANGPVTYMKPVQTGCSPKDNGQLAAYDYDVVMRGKVAPVLDFSVHVPYRFEPACSPHLAAELAGTEISLSHILTCFKDIRKRHKGVMLVEGAGGLMVPLARGVMMVDLAAALGAPVVLVTTPYLGTLNHTFLSVELLSQRKVPLAGVVCSQSRPGYSADDIHRDNIRTITEYIAPVPLLELTNGDGVNARVERFCDAIRR